MANVALKALPIVTVATPGTAVQITATDIDRVVAIYVSAPAANTGNVQIGDSGVEAAGTRSGLEVAKGVSPVVISGQGHYLDLKSIYVDALNAGDKVLISYLQVSG